MAMRVGEMMVIIRAQDFASRTLRRVGNEFAHMSREQMIAAKQAQLSAEKLRATTDLRAAERNLGRLRVLKQEQLAAAESARIAERYERSLNNVNKARQRFSEARTVQRVKDHTAAQLAHNKALDEFGRINQRVRVVTGKQMDQAFERLRRAQSMAGTGGEAAARELTAARRAVDDLGKSVKKQGPLMKQWRSAIQSVDKAYDHMLRTRRKAFLAEERTPVTERVARGAPTPGAALDAMRKARVESNALSSSLDKVNARWNKFGEMINKMPSRYQRLSQAINGTSNAQATMNEHMSAAHQRLRRAHDALDANTQKQLAFNEALRRMPLNRMQDMGHALGGVGRTMQLFGAVSTVALGAAANAAANFNTKVSLAATQARDLRAGYGQVGVRIDQLTNGFKQAGQPVEGILDLMERFPATQDEMADSAYDIFSSMNLMENGITNVAEGLGLLETANKIAVAGGEDLETATSAMITVFNNFDPQLKNTTETLDTMFDIIRFGRMRLGDFNTMMNKIAPAAQGANQTLRDVGGAMAFLTEVMPSQRMVATGISRLLEALNHPDIVKGLKEFEINVRKAEGGLKPLPVIMNEIAEAFPKLTTGQLSAAEFFKTISSIGRGGGQGVMFTAEGRKSATQIFTHIDEFNKRQKQIDDNTGEFAAAHAAQMEALGVQWKIFLNRVKAVVIAIGIDAIPVFQELGQGLKKMLDWWQSLDDETRKSIVRFAVFASVATLLMGALLAVVGAGLGLAAMIGRWGMALKGIEGVGGKALKILSKMRIAVGFLAAIGVISIVVDVTRSGDASAWDLLMGAVTGAAAGGAIGGPWGALIGGVTVPIALQLIDTYGPEKPTNAMQKLYRQYRDEAFEEGKPFDKTFKQFEAAWKKRFNPKKFKTPWTKGIEDVESHRAETSGMEAERGAIKKVTKATQDYQDALLKWAKDRQKYRKEMKEYNDDMERHAEAMAQYNQQLVNATRDAHSQMIDSLRSMYTEMLQLNEEAFGALGQGPHLGGESFQLAKEWGVVAGVADLTKDLRMQRVEFEKLIAGREKLAKLGAPVEMIREIEQAFGAADASKFYQKFIKASPKQRQALINEWKRGNKLVQSQTKMDFVDEIERFTQAGLDMGNAIKDGFQQAEVGAWFDSWVQKKFPNVINQAVNSAVAQWQQQNPPPKAPVQPVAPPRPIKPGPGLTNPAGFIKQENSNNTTTTYINVSMAGKGVNTKEQERLFGFIIRQSINGKLRVGGIPAKNREGAPTQSD